MTQTETALRLMTPDYASPEQARGDAITTTTDVYSLGVVLYELLTGHRPHQFKSLSPAEIERAICDAEIEEPSKVVSRMKDAPAKLARQFAGDLDNIALMAMRKEPERRYQSVEQFSEDIRRHLAGLPVVARKDTFGYRAGKFIRRHKLALGFVATTLALLLGVAITMAVQVSRISRERDRDRANLEAATAKEVTEFLVGSFELADLDQARGRAAPVREALDRSAAKVERELKGQPEAQARLMEAMGRVYQKLGLYREAELLLRRSLELRRRLPAGMGDMGDMGGVVGVARTLNYLGVLLRAKGDLAAAEPMLREALAIRRRVLGEERPEVAESLAELATALRDKRQFEEAEQLFLAALALRQKVLGDTHPQTRGSLNRLIRFYEAWGKPEQAARYRALLPPPPKP